MFPLCLHIINYKRYSCWLLFLCWSCVRSQSKSKVYSSDTWCILMYIASWNTSFHNSYMFHIASRVLHLHLLSSDLWLTIHCLWPLRPICPGVWHQWRRATAKERAVSQSQRTFWHQRPSMVDLRVVPTFLCSAFWSHCQDLSRLTTNDRNRLLGRPGSSFWSSLMLNGWKD